MAHQKKQATTQLGKQPPRYRFFSQSVPGYAVDKVSAMRQQAVLKNILLVWGILGAMVMPHVIYLYYSPGARA